MLLKNHLRLSQAIALTVEWVEFSCLNAVLSREQEAQTNPLTTV